MALSILDNKSILNKNLEKESAISLIPDYVFLAPDISKFIGRTILGGNIIICGQNKNLNNRLHLARFLFILRHEIAYKKWLIYDSNNKWTLKTPYHKMGDFYINEAGKINDMALYGVYDPK